MVVEVGILRGMRSIAHATEKPLIFGQKRLKRIEEILYLGFRMAPALSNLVILTPLLRGSQNTPRVHVKKEKNAKKRASEE